jgi:beta-phosphoglucomutase-like phosphatase (HAD superfamily)
MAVFRGTIFDVAGVLVDSPHEQAQRRDLKRSGSLLPHYPGPPTRHGKRIPTAAAKCISKTDRLTKRR